MALVLTFLAGSVLPSYAGTTGTISGTITNTTKTPLAGVKVVAVSPTERLTATTDSKGFFSLNGVSPDTYTVTFDLPGYQEVVLSAVLVASDNVTNASAVMSAATLKQIGRVGARSPASAFQPSQVVDQYTVTPQQITTILGKSGATNESNLLASLPGASFDSSGYPVLRGGRENEEGFQYEGIDYTDAFTSQFVNSLSLNGYSQFQVTPGSGDASIGNAGTGAINIVAKRGARPAFGAFELDANAPAYQHLLRAEYGFATPDGRFSNYASFTGSHEGFQYGPTGTPAQDIGGYLGDRNNQYIQEFTDNLIYKFGKDNNQSLQFFYDNTQFDLHLGYGGVSGYQYQNTDALWQYYEQYAYVGLTPAQVQSVIPLEVGQTSFGQTLGTRADESYYQPNETFKFQYSNNLDASTYLTAKFYRVGAVVTFDFPFTGGVNFSDFTALQGGERTGFALDLTRQLGSKNLLAFGGKYEYLHPVYAQQSSTYGFYDLAGFGNQFELGDFLQGGEFYGQRVPYFNESTSTNRQDYAFYAKDTFSPTDKLKIDFGARLDGVNYRYPKCDINTCLPTSVGYLADGVTPDPTKDQFNYDSQTRTPTVIEPRLNVSYQIGRNDSLRASAGRSVEFAPLGLIDLTGDRNAYSAFTNYPSTASTCGTTFDRPCGTYANQLYWEAQFVALGIPIQPVKPTTYNNYDLSYSHLFKDNISIRITPSYRQAFDATAITASQRVVGGVPQVDQNGVPLLNPATASNQGISKYTGLEFYLTKEANYGLSGQLTFTYQNELSNVIPTSASEDFFPSIPPESLELGNVYRVGFLSPFVGSLALNYKSHSGWRINPVLFYNHGYPLGSGNVTAFTVAGLPRNVPNTNITSPFGSTAATNYVDPQNPGSLLNPNIDATRGTPEAASAGGILSQSRITPAQLTIEFTPPNSPKNTFGVLISNLFDNLYGRPSLNARYQPVATGIAAPYSGYTSLAPLFGGSGQFNYSALRDPQQPYILTPGNTPRTFQFYYQLNF